MNLSCLLLLCLVSSLARLILSPSKLHEKLILQTDQFRIQVINSDNFFNLQVALLDSTLLRSGAVPLVVQTNLWADAEHDRIAAGLVPVYPDAPLHGLLGQTWKNVEYSNGMLFEGAVEQYMVNSLFETDFDFSRFKN